MHFSTTLATVAAVAGFVAAHDTPGLPRLAGLNVRDLKARELLSTLKARAAEVQQEEAHKALAEREALKPRQGGTDGQCGGTLGSCAAGYCCSSEGWCGNTADYCYSPGCQYNYGPSCPENATPAGTNTSTVARTKLGSVAYGGAGIYQCVTPGTVALTYDDGPFKNYTNHILDVFKSYNAKATFFMTGNNINKGEIDIDADHKATVQRAYSEGHQIASHTWTHLDLSAITTTDRKNQMYKNEMALRNILGFFPTYMRPPYSSCTAASGCEQTMADLGYHVVYFNVDTDDYDQDAPDKIQNSKNWFKGNVTAGGATPQNNEWLSIAHDIHEQTAYNLTEFMLSTLTTLGYKAVTVGECLGDPATNWYRSSSGSGTVSPSSSKPASSATSSAAAPSGTKTVTTDATCGGTKGFTCQGSTFGNCCSANGWCGSTADYCGTGCQSGFGTCGTGSTSQAPATSATKAASSAAPVVSSTTAAASKASSAPASAATKVSTDGSCGGTGAQTCKGSTFGNCCSSYGYCGSTSAYCGTGCNKSFGTCT